MRYMVKIQHFIGKAGVVATGATRDGIGPRVL